MIAWQPGASMYVLHAVWCVQPECDPRVAMVILSIRGEYLAAPDAIVGHAVGRQLLCLGKCEAEELNGFLQLVRHARRS